VTDSSWDRLVAAQAGMTVDGVHSRLSNHFQAMVDVKDDRHDNPLFNCLVCRYRLCGYDDTWICFASEEELTEDQLDDWVRLGEWTASDSEIEKRQRLYALDDEDMAALERQKGERA
jgi:hypothetical protein